MSMTLWLNVRTGDAHESDGEDRSALFALHEPIDALAQRLGVAPLSTFFDDTDLRFNMGDDELDDDADALEATEAGWPASAARWHDPAQVLQSVQALCTHLNDNPNAIRKAQGWNQADVLNDLQGLVPGLQAAQSAGQTVHLLVVM